MAIEMNKDLIHSGAAGHPVTFVVPAFDLFGFDNRQLEHTLKDIYQLDLIVLTNDQALGQNLTRVVKMIKAPLYDGDYLNKYFQYLIQTIRVDGTIVFLLPFFPFRTQQHIKEALDIFKRMSPSFLISINSMGNDAEMIYITTSFHFSKAQNIFADSGEAYAYMVDNVQAFKGMSPDKYKEALQTGVKRVAYSTEKQKELAAKYRDNLRDYDLDFLDAKEILDPVVLRSSKDAPQRIAKLVDIGKGDRILDIGCSSSNVAIKYARKTGPQGYVVGIDIDKELIGTAQSFLQKEPEEIRRKTRFLCISAEDFQDQLESFDTVAATEFFEHILHTQHDFLMRHCLKFLKPDGNMIVSVPNRFVNDFYSLQKRYRWDWYNHYTHFTRKSLTFFMERYFKKVIFHSVYDEDPADGIFLIAEGVGKK